MRKLIVPVLVSVLMFIALGSVVRGQLPVIERTAPTIKAPIIMEEEKPVREAGKERRGTKGSVSQKDKYEFELAWGQSGSVDQKLISPMDVVAVSFYEIYVVDRVHNQIKYFDNSGKFIAKLGGPGTAGGKFNNPKGIAYDYVNKRFYVADSGNSRVQLFDKRGNFVRSWGDSSKFTDPERIAVDSTKKNRIYVIDVPGVKPENRRIRMLDLECRGLVLSGIWADYVPAFLGPNYALAPGTTVSPTSIAVDPSSGNVYVSGKGEILKHDADGNVLHRWPIGAAVGEAEWTGGKGMVLDSQGNIYVTGRGKIRKFDSNGNLLAEWGSYGTGNGQFRNPQGISVDPAGNVYVADTQNNRIQKFKLVSQ